MNTNTTSNPAATSRYVSHAVLLIQCHHWLAEHVDAYREILPGLHRAEHAAGAGESLERLRDHLEDMLAELLADGDPATLSDASYAGAVAERLARSDGEDLFPVADLDAVARMRRRPATEALT